VKPVHEVAHKVCDWFTPEDDQITQNDMEHTVGILSRDRTDAYNNGLRTAIALVTEAALSEADRSVLIAGLEGSMLKEEK